MKINQTEISIYLVLFILTILLASLNTLSSPDPNLTIPQNFEQPTRTFEEPTFNQTNDPNPSEPRSTGFINVLFYILLAVVAFLLLRGLQGLKLSMGSRNVKSASTPAEIRRNLEDARIAAYRIIEEGLQNGTYTESFVEAYIALDLALDDFRDIKRPKHITPKEYAFSVSTPVFRPSVFRFVSRFYELRYGGRHANEEDLLAFREQLNFLFIDEVTPTVLDTWQTEYETAVQGTTVFEIPRARDPKRPRGI